VGVKKNVYRLWWGIVKARYGFEDVAIDGRIKIKYVLNKYKWAELDYSA
jgi:hypothetical protein